MKDINPTDLTNSAHSMKNKHRENYAQEPNSQPAEKIKHIKKKKKASTLARGKREKYFKERTD